MTTVDRTTGELTDLATLTDEQLLHHYAVAQQMLDYEKRALGMAEMEIRRRMDERGATTIPSARYDCQRRDKVEYDPAAFTPLKEIFVQPGDLERCWTPEHQETVTVPEKWSTVKVKAVAREYGDAALAIVERARMVRPAGLKFDYKLPKEEG